MRASVSGRWISVPLAMLLVASCSKKTPSATPDPGTSPVAAGGAVRLQGAGASFPAPLYLKWFKSFSASHANTQVDYQSVGSGSGVKSFIDKTVDFGASDAAMSAEEMARVDAGAQLLPMTAGSVVLAYNVEGLKELKLSRKAYVGLFLGTIKMWNDPAIVATNPGVTLPALAVNPVVRADSSGTTFVFTKHLSAVSEEFAKSPGVNKMPNWPIGTRSKGNEGVTAAIKSTPGAIGYIEFGYARSQKLSMATLENKSGAYVAPTTASGQAALAGATLPEDLIVWASDPEPKDAYPIVTYTWLLVYKTYADKQKLATLKDLVTYGLTDGQKHAEELGYIPLPTPVVEKVKAALDGLKAAG